MNPVSIIQGNSPIILSQPHSGTFVPDDILDNLNEVGRKLLDTDWHVPTLYKGLLDNVTVVTANFSRYVIDANRDPHDVSLYPGQNTTGLVPNTTFDGKPIWNKSLSEQEIATRLSDFHNVYHAALEAQIQRIKKLHGAAFLYDCHSIRSKIPFLFENKLPDINVGDNDGRSCLSNITNAVAYICKKHSDYTHVVNGRFKGGWTTRHYGQPAKHVFALQMELSQSGYLKSEAPPFEYDEIKAANLSSVLQEILIEIQNQMKTLLAGETK